MHGAPLWLSLVGIAVADYENAGSGKKAVVPKFLNRILGLEVSRQQKLFDYFARTLEKMIRAAKRDGKYAQGIQTVDGRSVEFERPAKALHVTTPSQFPIEVHTVVADVGMDFETAQRMLEETRSAGKATAIDIDGEDGDDDGEGGSTALVPKRDSDGEGWMTTGHVTNVSNNRGYVQPRAWPGERFGERDGFRLIEANNGEGESVCLIIESGESSMRGLSVKTDRFQVYFPCTVQDYMYWSKLRRLTDSLNDSKAKRLWDAGFQNRSKDSKSYLLTGPVLHVVPQLVQAQVKCMVKNPLRVEVARADEKDETGKRSGATILGVLLDYENADVIVQHIEDNANKDDDARASDLVEEINARDRDKEERQAHAKSVAGKERVARGKKKSRLK